MWIRREMVNSRELLDFCNSAESGFFFFGGSALEVFMGLDAA